MIKLCDKEHEYSNPGSQAADQLIWNDIKARAEFALAEIKKKAHEREMAELKKTVAELIAKAESGDASAQYELGKMYAHGNEIVTKDLKLARKWLRKAFDNGVENAWQELEKLPE